VDGVLFLPLTQGRKIKRRWCCDRLDIPVISNQSQQQRETYLLKRHITTEYSFLFFVVPKEICAVLRVQQEASDFHIDMPFSSQSDALVDIR